MPIYNQRSYGDQLGGGPGTIAMWGCYLTSYAQVLSDFGFIVDPPTLNQQIPYVNGNELSDYAVDGLFGGAVKTTGVWDFRNTPANLDMINDSDPSTRFIIELDFDHDPNDGIQTHFVTEASWNGTDLIINDPWYGTTDNFAVHYGTDLSRTIIKVVRLNGPAPVPAPVQTVPEPVQAPVAPVVEQPATPPVVEPVAAPAPAPTVPADPIIVPVIKEPTVEPTQLPTQPPVQQPNIKPGYQTTEFYVTIGLILLPLVNHFLGTQFSMDDATNFIVAFVGGLGAVIAGVSYIYGRLDLKKRI